MLGAVGGATVNVIFMNHFQRVARGHFAIRRLERRYGPNVVRHLYKTHVARDVRAERRSLSDGWKGLTLVARGGNVGVIAAVRTAPRIRGSPACDACGWSRRCCSC